MDGDTDLGGLDLAGAKDYLLAFAVEAKRLDKEVELAEAELALWRGRVALAEGKARPELAGAARAKAGELEAGLASLRAERSSLRSKVEAIRLQLPLVRARERSVDPDRLLAELQLMTGELLGDSGGEGRPGSAAAERELAGLEAAAKADAELAKLKATLGDPNAGGGGSRP